MSQRVPARMVLLAGVLLGATVSTPATASQSPKSVQTAAEQALRQHFAQPGSRLEITPLPLSSRLHLADCSLPLRAAIAENARPAPRMSVRVQCPQTKGWTVRVSLQLQLFRNVLVTSRPLLRGDGLRDADVRSEAHDITRLGYGYVEQIDQVAGRSLARALPAGSVLTPAVLGGRHMVRAGDRVQLIARIDGIEVRADGIALGSGDNGSRLRVRNESSGRVINAFVSAPGEVSTLP